MITYEDAMTQIYGRGYWDADEADPPEEGGQ